MNRSSAPNLHVIEHPPAPHRPPSSTVRCVMTSKPDLTSAFDDAVPASNMLLVSLCDAWHDIGERTSRVMRGLQPKTV